jgi:hypothetical protein
MNYVLPELFSDSIHWHWQNLNEGKAFGLHGRAWLRLFRPMWHVEWSLFQKTYFHIGINIGGEKDVSVHIGLWFMCIFFGVERLVPFNWLPRDWHRETGISMFEGGLAINLWNNDTISGIGQPKWRHTYINVVDALLGRRDYSERDISITRWPVSMPEGEYPSTIRMFESTWKRPRWPHSKTLIRAEVTPDMPISFPGKGENSWDCDDDATYSLTCVANSPQDAATKLAESVLNKRKRYG